MKNLLLYFFLITPLIVFQACTDDDDDDDTPATTSTNSGGGAGSGSGQGTGGGTGSGGIPPNSMKATIDGTEIVFPSVFGSLNGNDISISGTATNVYPQIIIGMADTIPKDSFNYPIMSGEPYTTYNKDMNTSYYPARGYVVIRNLDTSRKLVNGIFEITMKNLNDDSDSVLITKGEFNKFYN